jgi:hypothetical protein
MNRLLLLTTIILTSVVSAKAQNRLSIAAGVNYSSVSSINSANPDGTLGFNGGLAYKIYMNDLGWFIKPGLFYSQEGWQLRRLDYLNVPVIAGFDFTDDFNFNLGFQYGYLISGVSDLGDTVDKSNLAFLIGFEFYPADAFDVGLRFANGVKNIIANPDDPDLNGVTDARTYSIQFYFAFNLGKKAK